MPALTWAQQVSKSIEYNVSILGRLFEKIALLTWHMGSKFCDGDEYDQQ